jgi:hypothetical protein
MRVCPKCGYRDPTCWRYYRWMEGIDYTRAEEFFETYPQFGNLEIGQIVSDDHYFYRRSKRNHGYYVYRWERQFGRHYYKFRDFERFNKFRTLPRIGQTRLLDVQQKEKTEQ